MVLRVIDKCEKGNICGKTAITGRRAVFDYSFTRYEGRRCRQHRCRTLLAGGLYHG
jgi:hypothetical protein